MDRKGLLLPDYEVFLSDAAYDFIEDKKPKWMPKWFTKNVLLQLIRQFDNLILDRMPEKLKATFIPFLDAAVKGKLEEMRRLSTDVIADLVDWKGVTKDTQLYVYDSGTRFIVSLAMAFAEKRESKRLTA